MGLLRNAVLGKLAEVLWLKQAKKITQFSKTSYCATRPVWVEARDGKIWNGGINTVPKTFNPETGLSSPVRPTQKGGGGR